MKILVITPTTAPVSGTGRYSKAVLDEFSKKGISYSLLTESNGLFPLTSIAAAIKNVLAIRKATHDCDIIHAFDGWPYAIYARLAILGTSKKLFVNAVGTYAVAALNTPVKGFFLKSAYKKAKRIFAISNFVKDNVLKYIELDNIEVAYLGTTAIAQPSAQELENFRQKYGMGEQRPILLTVGALKDRKGQFETVEAVSLLKNKYPNILYMIVGSTKGSEAYARKIEEYIRENNLGNNVKIMTDLGSDRDLACAYNLSDIFLLNSKHDTTSEHSEGFGLVLLEAAQFGKPVIGSTGSGIPEAMENGYNGVLVDEVKAEAIVRAVEKVLARYEEFSRNSPEVAQRFSWEKTAEAYIKGYKS